MKDADNKVLYFAYGANRDIRMMRAITGRENLVGKSAILKGYTLCVQRYDQVPNVIAPGAPAPLSARQLLSNWSPETFTSYIIKPDEKGIVIGTLWELDRLERELVRDWELIDFGWYQDIKVKVTTEDGRVIEVEAEGLRPGQEVDHEVDGLHYETWLNSPEDFERVATKAREEYLDRIGGNPEWHG